MVYSESEVLRYVEENDVKFIKLTFCDLRGKLKNISILSAELPAAFSKGVRITAKKICGFSTADGNDLFLFPDPRTMRVLPWRPAQGRVVRIYCFIRYADGRHFESDGRYFLKKASKAASEKGYYFRFGTSSEFTLFLTDENGFPTKTPHDFGSYCDAAPSDRGENFRRDVCLTLEQMGINPVSSRHQSGNGQHEIDFGTASSLSAADTFMSFKSAVKSIAVNHGVFASFMPKPLKYDCGNGMHIGFSVCREKDMLTENKFFEEDIRHAAAGIIAYIKDIALFTNSTVNSYSRLGEFSAPRYITWSHLEEEQLLRVSNDDPDMPVVLRAPDCVCNPYFVFGLMIYAAMEGIERGFELPDEFDPAVTDYEKLPLTLIDAVETAAESVFLKKYLPQGVLDEMRSEAENEWKKYSAVIDKEIYETKEYFYDL